MRRFQVGLEGSTASTLPKRPRRVYPTDQSMWPWERAQGQTTSSRPIALIPPTRLKCLASEVIASDTPRSHIQMLLYAVMKSTSLPTKSAKRYASISARLTRNPYVPQMLGSQTLLEKP